MTCCSSSVLLKDLRVHVVAPELLQPDVPVPHVLGRGCSPLRSALRSALLCSPRRRGGLVAGQLQEVGGVPEDGPLAPSALPIHKGLRLMGGGAPGPRLLQDLLLLLSLLGYDCCKNATTFHAWPLQTAEALEQISSPEHPPAHRPATRHGSSEHGVAPSAFGSPAAVQIPPPEPRAAWQSQADSSRRPLWLEELQGFKSALNAPHSEFCHAPQFDVFCIFCCLQHRNLMLEPLFPPSFALSSLPLNNVLPLIRTPRCWRMLANTTFLPLL